MNVYKEFAPAPALQPYIECYWSREGASASGIHRVLPDGCIDILIETSAGRHNAFVVGTMTRPLLVEAASAETFTGVRFKPGCAHAFFDLPMTELTDRTEEISNFWDDAQRFLDVVAPQTSTQDRISSIERELLGRLPHARRLDKHIAAAVSLIRYRLGQVRIDELSSELGITRQYLTRKFDAHVGVSPKAFSRIVRLQSVLRRIEGVAEVDWTTVACDSGYFDQAHLISEFHDLVGLAPTSFNRFHSSNTSAAPTE